MYKTLICSAETLGRRIHKNVLMATFFLFRKLYFLPSWESLVSRWYSSSSLWVSPLDATRFRVSKPKHFLFAWKPRPPGPEGVTGSASLASRGDGSRWYLFPRVSRVPREEIVIARRVTNHRQTSGSPRDCEENWLSREWERMRWKGGWDVRVDFLPEI